MLIETYNLLILLTFVCMIISFLSSKIFKDNKNMVIFPFLTALLFSSLAMMSSQIEHSYCEYSTVWQCTVQEYQSIPLMWFFGLMGIMMFVYGMLEAFVWSRDVIKSAMK